MNASIGVIVYCPCNKQQEASFFNAVISQLYGIGGRIDLEKTSLSATLSTTNPTWPHIGKPVNNCVNYVMSQETSLRLLISYK
jgi:hypothetical protein